MYHQIRKVVAFAVLIGAAACSDEVNSTTEPEALVAGITNAAAVAAHDAVLAGNLEAVTLAPMLVPEGHPLAPFVEARLYAITNLAMHDALNAIIARYERFADTGAADEHASPAAALLTAAHDAIAGADPAAKNAVDVWYAKAIGAVSNEGKDAGIAIGRRAASAVLAARTNDGVAAGGVAPYTAGTHAGDYQFTFPFNTPDFNFFGTGGFADANVWAATVRTFVVTSASQFRAPPPYGAANNAAAVQTAAYTNDYNEVKRLGCATCTARTAEQTEIAKFWAENSPTGWNRIARQVGSDRKLDAWDMARLFALLQIAEFDSYTTSLESKYYYNFWRPVTAMELAATDGNDATASMTDWQVVVFPTPPVPDYPSAHSSAGGAAASVIEALLPGAGKPFSTTSTSLPDVLRVFATVADAANENALSRVYIGYHFRHATEAGLAQGRTVGSYVASHALKALKKP